MSLSLDRDESVAAVAESVGRYCGSLAEGAGFAEAWRGFAELGLFSLPELFGDNSHAAMVAAMETLGRNGFYGPVADTLTFAACAPADLLEPVVAGEVVACLGRPPLVPWPDARAIHVTEAGGGGRRARRDALRRSVGACARLGRPGARPLCAVG